MTKTTSSSSSSFANFLLGAALLTFGFAGVVSPILVKQDIAICQAGATRAPGAFSALECMNALGYDSTMENADCASRVMYAIVDSACYERKGWHRSAWLWVRDKVGRAKDKLAPPLPRETIPSYDINGNRIN